MNKIRVIDLLNKIANGELEDLTLVNFCKNNCLAKYHKTDNRFEFMNKGEWDDYFHLIDIEELNDEVEVIEEKEIENIPFDNEMPLTMMEMYHQLEKYNYKINQIIDVMNDMRDKE